MAKLNFSKTVKSPNTVLSIMSTGVNARLERISTDGRIVSIPMDHGITIGPTKGLVDIESTIDAVTQAGADCILTQKGLASRVHPNTNGSGYIVHLNGSTSIGPDKNDKRLTSTVKEAVRVGGDAVSYHINVGSETEPRQIEQLSQISKTAGEFGLPVLVMAYARGPGIAETDAENLAHAVRLAEEVGADLVKTAYTGGESFKSVARATQLPVLMAGGDPQNDRAMLENVSCAMSCGAAGVSMGRSVFQHTDPESMTNAISLIVHESATVETAIERSGL